MVRCARYGAQGIPYRKSIRSKDLLKAGAGHSGSGIEHCGARGYEHARDLGCHGVDIGVAEVVADDACGVYESDAARIEQAARRIVQWLCNRLVYEHRFQRCSENVSIGAMRGAC